MAIMVEREARADLEVKKVPEEIELPEHLKKDGITAIETAYKANVQDGGQALTQTPQNQKVTITLPSDPKTLTTLSKGSITSAVTWLAMFWLRAIKRAMHFGWNIVRGGQNAS